MQADVGFAIGTGTDVAIEASDVTLIKGSLVGVVTAIEISRATMRNVRQNLVGAFGYNSLGIPVAMGVLYPFTGLLLSPLIAAAALNFRREETESCSDKVIFADFQKSADLPKGQTVAVELLPKVPGEFGFGCPMGCSAARASCWVMQARLGDERSKRPSQYARSNYPFRC